MRIISIVCFLMAGLELLIVFFIFIGWLKDDNNDIYTCLWYALAFAVIGAIFYIMHALTRQETDI